MSQRQSGRGGVVGGASDS